MKIFKLPDLGEGLPDAEIREWFVKVGDEVALDQPMVAMETAKAVVEVPAPRQGKIAKLYGDVGSIINTGAPLVEFTDGEEEKAPAKTQSNAATVVGSVTVGDEVITESPTGITPKKAAEDGIKAIPAVRKLAQKLKIDLSTIVGTGPDGKITVTDVQKAKANGITSGNNDTNSSSAINGTPLRGFRRAMAQTMAKAHHEIAPVTVTDDADIHAWPEKTDITYRIIRAVIAAVKNQPQLNAWFDGQANSIQQHNKINLGIAIDSDEGLFVPVIKDIANLAQADIRSTIKRFKEQVQNRSIPQEELQGATIVLSNYGSIAGRYANPIIPPPCVAIVGTGKIRDAVVADAGQVSIHRIVPLAITVDHRVITGGEVMRFLRTMMDDLELSN